MLRRRRRSSIYQHVLAHIEPGTPGLQEGGEALPDAAEAFGDGPSWAPGALEGAMSRYGQPPDDNEERAADLHQALLRLADEPNRRTRSRASELFRAGANRSLMDALLQRLSEEPPDDRGRLYSELRTILLETGNRDELKFAIALVGTFGRPEDADVFRALARHEEFTLYAAVALAAGAGDPVGEWLSLLPDVSDWGATELSELLVAAKDDRVCGILLRRGASIGNALLLAEGCKLHEALDAEDVDDDLIHGAQSIIDDLTWSVSGPETLLDYPDAGRAVERFLELLAPRATTLNHLLTAYEIGRHLEPLTTEDAERLAELFGGEVKEPPSPDEHYLELAGVGFDEARLERVHELSRAIVERPGWRGLAEADLESEDPARRRIAIEAAKRLGLPLRDYLVRRIEADPNDGSLWFHLAWGADAERIGEVVRLAERVLDLDALASGPALERFGPPGSEGPHQAANYVLQELPRFPGVGKELLVAALSSPVIRDRLLALRVLSGWPRDVLDEQIMLALRACLDDPAEDVRSHAGAVLRGEPIPKPSLALDADEDD